MRKTYDLPENASFEHMTSFLTAKGLKFVCFSFVSTGFFSSGTLVVEFPLVTPPKERGE